MLVEGEAIMAQTNDGKVHHFNYAETFVISASVQNLEFTNTGTSVAKLIKAYLK